MTESSLIILPAIGTEGVNRNASLMQHSKYLKSLMWVAVIASSSPITSLISWKTRSCKNVITLTNKKEDLCQTLLQTTEDMDKKFTSQI